jgi:hypothetical protein
MADRTRLPEPNWSFEISDKLKLAIADSILLYSKIESCIVELVWLIEGADLKLGPPRASRPASIA